MNNVTNVMNGANNQHQPSMSEKELLDDLLTQEKHLFSVYSNAVVESGCVQLRDLLLNSMNGVCEDQFNIFDQMAKRGFYPLKAATPQDIQAAKQMATNTQGQLH